MTPVTDCLFFLSHLRRAASVPNARYRPVKLKPDDGLRQRQRSEYSALHASRPVLRQRRLTLRRGLVRSGHRKCVGRCGFIRTPP